MGVEPRQRIHAFSLAARSSRQGVARRADLQRVAVRGRPAIEVIDGLLGVREGPQPQGELGHAGARVRGDVRGELVERQRRVREHRDAVAPGRISIATTRIAPTDSKALTITTESQAIRRKCTTPARMPSDVASPGSKELTSSSL